MEQQKPMIVSQPERATELIAKLEASGGGYIRSIWDADMMLMCVCVFDLV